MTPARSPRRPGKSAKSNTTRTIIVPPHMPPRARKCARRRNRRKQSSQPNLRQDSEAFSYGLVASTRLSSPKSATIRCGNGTLTPRRASTAERHAEMPPAPSLTPALAPPPPPADAPSGPKRASSPNDRAAPNLGPCEPIAMRPPGPTLAQSAPQRGTTTCQIPTARTIYQ
jgi:hypothetical protein